MTHTIKHVGTIRTAAGEWNLYDQYPTNRRDYKITSAVHIGAPAQSIAFTTDASFERWLTRNMAPTQLPLL
jgi:hypothetical protein